jgi:phosphatidylinositol alpha-1,6-mannosyltransferase
LLERWTYARCDRVLVSSPLIADYIERLSGGKTASELLRLSVDTTRFVPGADALGIRARYGIPDDARVAVFVGTLFPFAGLLRLLDHWDEARARDPRAHLLIVGGGPQEDALRERVTSLKDPSGVTMTGMVPYDEVPDHIRAAQVGICPFEILPVTQDINPVKVVGYLACGIPTVCSTLDGTMAVLPHDRSGVLYARPGGEFVDTLLDLLGDDEECSRLGEVGRSWAVEHHSIDSVVDQLEHDLASAIEHVAARRRTTGTGGA